MICLDNIHLTFGANTVMEKKAIRGISLNIEEGQFITVIGSNGAGKSTLLNTIAGEHIPTSGSILFDDMDVTKRHDYKRSKLVARVFQDPRAGTCADLTVAENMALAMDRGGARRLKFALNKNRMDVFRTCLSRLNLGLEDRLDTNIGMLSGGQRQAISLLMATLSPLKILLLDEHTSALDPKTAGSILKITEDIVREKKLTVLMVTHSLQQALQYGNRTIMLHEGRMIYDVCGDVRSGLTVNDLLNQFGANMDDDRLLLQKNP